MGYPGLPGFLSLFFRTRASLMLDVVFVAMFAVLPVLALSMYLVRYRRRYRIHKAIQLTLGAVLLLAVTAFEVDMRFFTDWQKLAEPSPYFNTWVFYSLYIHLLFAVSTAALWVFVIVQALRKIPVPPGPSPYSRRHAFWARLAALDMFATAVTGWIFYWLAFVAVA